METLEVHQGITQIETMSVTSLVKCVLQMRLFGVTLSQVSSSAALSHSKAFQFMSSTEKDISFKQKEDDYIHNSQQLKKQR